MYINGFPGLRLTSLHVFKINNPRTLTNVKQDFELITQTGAKLLARVIGLKLRSLLLDLI